MPTISELSDPRLVAIYDTVNPIAEYETFYLDLAAKRSASSIIDIGYGTGLLTRHGHRAVAWFSVVQTSATSILILLAPNPLLSNRTNYPRAWPHYIRELRGTIHRRRFENS